jgi:hypothetical protein
MIRAYLTSSHSRLQRENTWRWADPVPIRQDGVRCHHAPATSDPFRTAAPKGSY